MIIKRAGKWKRWTYGDIHRIVARLANALILNGICNGDRIILVGDNTPEWVITYHAALFCGAIIVPLDAALTTEEILAILSVVEPKIIFCSKIYTDLFHAHKHSFSNIAHIIKLPSAVDEDENAFVSFFENRNYPTTLPVLQSTENDPTAILFTSGTTGSPKGAVILQRNYHSACIYGPQIMELGFKDRAVAILPLHHVFGFIACCAAPLAAGMATIFVPEPKGPLLLEAIRENRVTMLPAVPQMLELLLQNIKRGVDSKGIIVKIIFRLLNLLSMTLGHFGGLKFRRALFCSVHKQFGGELSTIISGGSSISKTSFNSFRLMGFRIVEGYGLTETLGPISLSPAKDARVGSVGPVLPGNHIKIANRDKNGIGELRFKGSTVFGGYYNMNQSTKDSFDNEGYFKTGDLGRITNDGFIYITGRIKDVIVLESGKNVYPDELECFYAKSPIIAEIAIFGHKRGNRESVAAVVVPASDLKKRHTRENIEQLIKKELLSLSNSQPSHKRISEWVVSLHPLPRTSTRKVRKQELIAQFNSLLAGTDTITRSNCLTVQEKTISEKPIFKQLLNLISELSNYSGIPHPRALLETDLVIDSLRKMELAVRIEQTCGKDLAKIDWSKLETLSDLAIAVEDAPQSVAQNSITANYQAKPSTSLLFRIVPYILLQFSKLIWNFKISHNTDTFKHSGVVFYANHESYLDPILFYSVLPWQIRRKTFAVGKSELSHSMLIGRLLQFANFIPIDRDGDPREALKTSLEILKKGYNLLIFPEGTRSTTGKLSPFRTGTAKILSESGATAIPIRFQNTGTIWPKGKLPQIFNRKLSLEITFGELVKDGESYQKGESLEAITGILSSLMPKNKE